MRFKEFFLLEENTKTGEIGSLYHGGSWNGKTPFKTNNIDGSLGTGGYLTESITKSAQYAKESPNHAFIVECFAKINNPLITYTHDKYNTDPVVFALTQLQIEKQKAISIVEKLYDKYGSVKSYLKNLALAKNYDSIIQYDTEDEISELVIYDKNKISRISNVMPFNTK